MVKLQQLSQVYSQILSTSDFSVNVECIRCQVTSISSGLQVVVSLEPNLGVAAKYLEPKPLDTKRLAPHYGQLWSTTGILHTRAATVPLAIIFHVAL